MSAPSPAPGAPKPTSAEPLILSYLALRRAIGIIGTLLPFVLAIGGFAFGLGRIEVSMSAYYYTPMRDVFVGALCAIAVFLASNRGYARADARAGDVAGGAAIGVALFPTRPPVDPTPAARAVGMLHHLSAAIFFLTLAYFCLELFRRTDPTRAPTARKRQRNVVYTICGWLIIGCLVAIVGVKQLIPDTALARLAVVFWLEATAVVAFGVAWLTKGEFLLPDLAE